MAIKLLLKRKLALNEMTQKELAAQTGIRPPTISAMCQNSAKHIPLDVLDKICNALKCQPGDIVEHIPNNEATVYNVPAAPTEETQPAADRKQ